MRNYQNLLEDVLLNGTDKDDRTGVGTRSVFGRQLRWDLSKGFPLVTTKKLGTKLILSELLWFLSGDTSIAPLLKHNNNIWNEWSFKKWVESDEYDGPDMADFGLRVLEDSSFKAEYQRQLAAFKERIVTDEAFAKRFDLGPVYGKQWRTWETNEGLIVDQIAKVIDDINRNPDSRRHLVSAWNVGELDKMALVPCHYSFQFYVANGKLSCMWNQRSVDSFLGLPFNIASYAFLTHMVAEQCDLEVGELVFNGGDVHLYQNHIEQAQLQISRTPYDLPKLRIKRKPDSIFDYSMEDFEIAGYEAHPHIKGDIAV